MRGVQHILNGGHAMPIFAACDKITREHQIVENASRICEVAKRIIIAEEMIMPKRRMRNDERLHRNRIAFHHIGNAGAGIDDDLIGQPRHAFAILHFMLHEALAVRPVRIINWHAGRCISVQHLLRRNDFNLVGIYLQTHFAARDLFYRIMHALNGAEAPVGILKQKRAHDVASALCARKRSRNTGKISCRVETRRIAGPSSPRFS